MISCRLCLLPTVPQQPTHMKKGATKRSSKDVWMDVCSACTSEGYERKCVCMYERMDGWMNVWLSECMYVSVNACIYVVCGGGL